MIRHVLSCNTLCVNPAHLRPGTQTENCADRDAAAAHEDELVNFAC